MSATWIVTMGCLLLTYQKVSVRVKKEELGICAAEGLRLLEHYENLQEISDILWEHGDFRLLVMNGEGEVLAGEADFLPSDVPLVDGEMRIYKEKWLVYDLAANGKWSGMWIRGSMLINARSLRLHLTFRLFWGLLPLTLFLIAVGSYWIAKRVFAPVVEITKIADEIGKGEDLSKRVRIKGWQGDELVMLANTFDRMIERLQVSFDREKQFTMDVSHELRTPMAVIMSECENGLEDGQELTQVRSSLQNVQRQARQLNKLIKYLLVFSRVDRGARRPLFEWINLTMLAQAVVEEMEVLAGQRQIRIYFRSNKGIRYYGDEMLLMRIFINLLSNAIQYGRDGGEIHFILENREEYIYGEVRDNGIGISEENLSKIWNRFFQAERSRSEQNTATLLEGSMGLGLAMVKGNVETHGGEIWADSRLEEGSKFCFTLSKDLEDDGR